MYISIAGDPGRFLKYDVERGALTDLGAPAEEASYWLGHAVGPNGVFYVGSYPATHLVAVDPAGDRVRDLGRIADDPNEKYIIHPAVSRENIVYCPVGLHHRELWAYDAKTEVKKQILPERLTVDQGAPRIWAGADGEVYGRAVRARNGLIYGLAGNSYYAFDPVQRSVAHTGALPVQGVRWPGLAPEPGGPDGLVIGLGEDAVFAIDPADHGVRVLARDESIRQAHGMFLTEDGVLDFGSGPYLMRVDLYSGQ